MGFKENATDYFKIALLALLPGLILAPIWSALTSMFGSLLPLVWILDAVVLIWAVSMVPKEFESFWSVLIVTFLLMGYVGFLGLMAPAFSAFVSWANVASLLGFFNMLVIAALGLGLINKYTSWL